MSLSSLPPSNGIASMAPIALSLFFIMPLLVARMSRLAHLLPHRERFLPERLIGAATLESQRSTVRFDPEHGEGEPDGHSASREEQEGRCDRLDRRLRRNKVARAGDQRKTQAPSNLADPIARQ